MTFLLLATELFNVGGIQTFNTYLAKALLELGHTMRIVSMKDSISTNQLSSLSTFELSSLPATRRNYLQKPMFVANTIKHTLNGKPDIILCGHINYSALCMVLQKIIKIPYFTITHGIEAWNLNGFKLTALRHSDKILSVSRFSRNKILGQLPDYPEKDIFILPDTVDADKFRPGPKLQHLMNKWGIKMEDKVLLTIARMSKTEKYKGYDRVIDAMRDVIKEVPNVKYIIGGSGDDMRRIEKLIKDNNLGSRVILTGFIPHDEVADYYNLCDVFVMPSKGEGFGIVFLEALTCGKPVIAGNKDASPDVLLDGELGILVDPDNLNEIKEAIVKVLKREVPERFFNSSYLRQRTIETYGYQKFKERLGQIIKS